LLELPGLETSILVDFVRELQPKNVLEVGCNYGRELKLLEGMTKIVGVDKDEEKVRQKIVPGIRLGNGNNLPFISNFFSLVYTDGCLSHNEKPKKILSEMVRVSKNYVLLIEWIGTKTGTTFDNVKKHSWIHDYEKMISVLPVEVCFNRKMVFGADMFHVILLRKPVQPKNVINFTTEVKEDKFCFSVKIGKYIIGVKKDVV
jgi:SAM-dependent methyltransferase